VDLATVVAEETVVVERGLERVERAVTDGVVGDPHRRARVELLSYPVARVLVSLVDEPPLTDRYARAEAATARQRPRADAETDLRSASEGRLDLADLLAEFDLDAALQERPGEGTHRYTLGVTAYLRLATGLEGERWRLVNRSLADGRVPVSDGDLFDLLEAAIEERVRTDLPFDVPERVAGELGAERTHVVELLGRWHVTGDIDAVVPDLFPPCMQHLLKRVRDGEQLAPHSRFAITAFLGSIGMSADEIVELYGPDSGIGEVETRYGAEHVRGERGLAEYPSPSCATMQVYGDCVNMDDLCETISHPLAYYEERLDRDGATGDRTDWREREV
jgi:DNA primase large subunit